MTGNNPIRPAEDLQWQEENRAYLEAQLKQLRLLLRRRVLWLRKQWSHNPMNNYQGLVISDTEADWLLVGEDHQAEAQFYQEDKEAAEISQSLVQAEKEIDVRKERLTRQDAPSALERLANLFNLTSFEQNTLLLCLAPELDPGVERIYAYLQDDATRKYVTPHLALTMFSDSLLPKGAEEKGGNGLASRDSFLPDAPLRRFGLLNLESGPLSAAIPSARPLRLDDRIADYLLGVNRPDERIAALLRPMAPALLAPPHKDLLDGLVRILVTGAGPRPWPILNLTGSPGIGKRSVSRALCDLLGLQLYSLDTGRLPPPGPERQAMVHLIEREAVLSRFALFIDSSEVDSIDRAALDSLDDLIERLGVFLIVGSLKNLQAKREILSVSVPKLDNRSQHIQWCNALGDRASALDGHIEAVVQQFDFGPESIAQTVAAAVGRARLRAGNSDIEVKPDDLWHACRNQAGMDLDKMAQRISPCFTWEDIVLSEDVLLQLQEIAAQITHRPQVYDTWGFGKKLNRGRGINALFSGPSGTGKTMAAEILANHLDLDLYRIDLAGVVSKYIGETEKNLKKVFDAAEQSGAILFFDEADALFGKRTEVKDSHDRYANIEVNYLLQRMEDYRGLAVLATNMKSLLDQAFLRRLRFLVDFPFPDATLRMRIWKKVFPEQAEVDGLDSSCLAQLEIPGGNIKNIAINSAFLAAAEGRFIGMSHVMHAARREYSKIDKLMSAGEFGSYFRRVRS